MLRIPGAFQSTEYDDGIIVPKLFYKPTASLNIKADNVEGSKECVLTVEDLTTDLTTDLITDLNPDLNTDLITDLSTVSGLISFSPDSKIVSEAVEVASRAREAVRVRRVSPCQTPHLPLVALYQPSVPVSQVWERDYRTSQFERLVYPNAFRQS